MKLLNSEKEWIEKAIDKDIPRLEIIVKLEKAGKTPKEVNNFLKYYDKITAEKKMPKITDKDDEIEFEMQVKTYFKNPKELNYFKRREVKKWVKNLEKQIKVFEDIIELLEKNTVELVRKHLSDSEKIDKEIQRLKEMAVDSLLDTSEIFYLENPRTGEEATKENLMELKPEEILQYIKSNKELLQEVVNGKL